jgi:hypothetical protein
VSVIPPYQPGQSLSDYVTSIIRTVVPFAWGLLITYLVSLLPGVAPTLLPAMPVVLGWGPVIAGAIAAGWYALMRKIEPKLPAWLTVIVLGSNKTPAYVDPNSPSVRGLAAGMVAAHDMAAGMASGQVTDVSDDAARLAMDRAVQRRTGLTGVDVPPQTGPDAAADGRAD